jgi:hypothetical protein
MQNIDTNDARNETNRQTGETRQDSNDTHNDVSAVNLLISGGIELVSLLSARSLLSQNESAYFINTSEQGKCAYFTFLTSDKRHTSSRKYIVTAMVCNKLKRRTLNNK